MAVSLVVSLATAVAAFLTVAALRRVQIRWLVWLTLALLWCAAITAILFVDVNVPLSESHLRPSGAPAPLWLAIFALFTRFAALAAVIVLGKMLRQPFTEPNKSEARF